MNMNYSLVYPDQSRLVGTESISPSQLDEVRYFVEIVEPIKFPLYQKTWPGVLYGTEGAYAFIRLPILTKGEDVAKSEAYTTVRCFSKLPMLYASL
ncbi:hypothetical protein [Pseudophaeobacter sp. C1-32P7]|uniref:hypothetical protein n=1 Tax=Pseudophaeobacter sp. C1-32P7 TaxID=3098142 RepID=UPI0034D4C488